MSFSLSMPTLPGSAPRGNSFRRLALGGAVAIAALATLGSSCYVVEPTGMAGVRRLGVVVSASPVGPGPHLKLPFVDQVDRIQVTLTTFQSDTMTVYTVDNQPVRIAVGLSYRVPPSAVFKLLYGVGRAGDVNIQANLRPVVADRALRVSARRNTVAISAERESIAAEIRQSVLDSVRAAFGIEVVDLQLSRIEYSPSFTQSVEAAVRAKNDAIQAENTVARIRFEGEQAKVQAEAEAAAQVSRAEGDAKATVARAGAERDAAILRAEGEARASSLVGEAQAHVVQQIGAAVAANPQVVAYETARRWTGQLPQTVLSTGAVPFVSLPGAPAPTPAAAPGR